MVIIIYYYRMPSLRLLQAFAAVADLGQFSLAAQRLNVTQPALSLQVKDLETRLGVTLIERSPGQRAQIALTAAGYELLPKARAVLALADEFTDAARRMQAPLAGRLRLGVIPTIAPYLLPQLLPRLQKTYRQASLQVTEDRTERLVAALRAGELDVALLALPLGISDLHEQKLYDDSFHLVAHRDHAIWQSKKPTTQEILDGPLLLLEDGHCLRDQALSYCRAPRAALTAQPSFKAASLSTLVELVANGYGVTLLPAMALPREVGRNKQLKTLQLPNASRTIGLLYRARHPQAAEFKKLGKLIAA